jgi:adenine-specific DNA-methyltransferase
MKGFVETPPAVIDFMVDELFRDKPPTKNSRLLDPGCGNGAFIDGVIRWCERKAVCLPSILGVELDPDRAQSSRQRFRDEKRIAIREADFLTSPLNEFDYVIGNPPYVAITSLNSDEKAKYRERFAGASGRFDLYLLFFEHAVRALTRDGRLVFITPEKFLYVSTAAPLRRLLASFSVDRLHFVDEDTFEGLVTYPLISEISASVKSAATAVTFRDGTTRSVRLPANGESWLKSISSRPDDAFGPTLKDVAERVSCGIATGADSVFIVPTESVPPELRTFAYPTISGRQISKDHEPVPTDSILVPYRPDGSLISEENLGALRNYLAQPATKEKLIARTCADRKPWYAYHESPVPSLICRPKILCKDIGSDPFFVLDRSGVLLPRHSVYYIIPSNPAILEALFEYLNSDFAKQWLRDHCQRAAKGFVRLQSHVLKELPIPEELSAGSGVLFARKKSA